MSQIRASLLSCLVMLVATLAMTATGFAHRFDTDKTSPDLLAYLNMGGTLAEICGDIDPAHHLSNTCDACLITSSAWLPDTAKATPLQITFNRTVLFPCTPHVWGPATPENKRRARAPPFIAAVNRISQYNMR